MTCCLSPLMELPIMAQENGADFVISSSDPLASVVINNKALGDLGFKVAQVASWLDAPTQTLPEVVLPGLAGSVHSDDRPRVTPLDIKIVGTLVGADRDDARAKRDRIMALLRNSPVTIVFPDSLQRYLVADLAVLHLDPVGASFNQSKFPAELTLHAFDPYRYDLVDTAPQAPAGVAIRCPLGTAPTRPVLTISGPAVNPILTFSDYAGVGIGSLTLTVALIASDTLVVDCALGKITKNGAALNTAITVGDFIQFDPAIHANRDLAAWPIVNCSSGACQVRYRRAWS